MRERSGPPRPIGVQTCAHVLTAVGDATRFANLAINFAWEMCQVDLTDPMPSIQAAEAARGHRLVLGYGAPSPHAPRKRGVASLSLCGKLEFPGRRKRQRLKNVRDPTQPPTPSGVCQVETVLRPMRATATVSIRAAQSYFNARWGIGARFTRICSVVLQLWKGARLSPIYRMEAARLLGLPTHRPPGLALSHSFPDTRRARSSRFNPFSSAFSRSRKTQFPAHLDQGGRGCWGYRRRASRCSCYRSPSSTREGRAMRVIHMLVESFFITRHPSGFWPS